VIFIVVLNEIVLRMKSALKKLKGIKNAISMHDMECDVRDCHNIICCAYDSDYHEHNNRILLYVTDLDGNVIDDAKPHYVHECSVCANNAYFCSDACYCEEDICFKCFECYECQNE
jgi:hypothetical protein